MSRAPERATPATTRFNIDINFSVASRQAWSNAKTNPCTEFTNISSSNAPRYNLRSRLHRVDSAIASPSGASSVRDDKLEDQPSRPTRANGARWSKGLGKVPNSLRERLLQILPMDTRTKLRKEPKMCVALTEKPGNPQCTRKTQGPIDVLKRVPNTLTGRTVESADDASITFVRALIESALCGRSHRTKRMSHYDEICRGLDELSEDDRAVFDEWIMALASEPLTTEDDLPTSQIQTEGSAKIPPRTTRRQEASTVSLTITHPTTRLTTRRSRLAGNSLTPSLSLPSTNNSFQTYFPEFVPYRPKSTAGTTESVLRDLIARPLKKRELHSGFIYIYWFPGIFGHIKIGQTRVADFKKRLEQWRRKCRHAAEPVDALLVPVRHAYRVEALVHRELKDVRLREVMCRGCGGDHIEWFRETPTHAWTVISKFADWMETEPYEYGVGGEDTTGWTLKPDQKIEKLCRPLERDAMETRNKRRTPAKKASASAKMRRQSGRKRR